jgi:hypothetical protein
MKIEGVSIHPVRPLTLRNWKIGGKSDPLITREFFDERLQSAFVGITGQDWELKYLKDVASLYELNPKDESVFLEALLTARFIDRLSVSLTLEDKDAQIHRLRDLLLKLEADRSTCDCTCT